MNNLFEVPAPRREAAQALWKVLEGTKTVALSTHVNADGDGCGSQTALARLLAQRGIAAHIVNPTPWPTMFRFLLGTDVVDRSSKGAAALRGVDGIVVLDISDISRLGGLAEAVRAHTSHSFVIDHHIAGAEPPGKIAIADVTACATGELVYDFAMTLGFTITPAIATSLYAAILTDTGSFRYANTSPRCHVVAADLLRCGVDPEEMYRRIYASVPANKLFMLRDALTSLVVDESHGIASLDIAAGAVEAYGLRSEDLDGIVEHARSIAGTRIALLFRDLGHGKVKVSFRSTGEIDVNALARQFGGGGHARASGAMIGGSLVTVKAAVLGAARTVLAASNVASASER